MSAVTAVARVASPRVERLTGQPPRHWARVAWGTSPALVVLTLVAAAGLVASAVGYVLDERAVLGISTWNKPAKFAISFLFFAPTLIAIFAPVRRSRTMRVSLEVIGWSMVVEFALVLVQAGRAVASHYNTDTAFDGAVWAGMAAGVGIFTVVAFVAGAVLVRHRLASPALRLAVQLAVPMMTVGATLGYLMSSSNADTIATTGGPIGAHTVGAVDGGPGLPLLGWSTEHGDLRIAHFLGLHAAQAVPLAGLLVAVAVGRGWLSLGAWAQRRLVLLAAAGYAGVVATVLVQAVREQPLVRPDATTVAMLAASLLVPAALAAPDLVLGRRRAR